MPPPGLKMLTPLSLLKIATSLTIAMHLLSIGDSVPDASTADEGTHLVLQSRNLLSLPCTPQQLDNATDFLKELKSLPPLAPETLLQRASSGNLNIQLLLRLQDEGKIGFIASIVVLSTGNAPTGYQTGNGDDDEGMSSSDVDLDASAQLLVMHRGAGRCCNPWCGGE